MWYDSSHLYPPILTHYELIMHVKPFQPLVALVGLLYVPRSWCLLLSAVDPIGTGGHGDPNRGTLPGETGHLFVTADFPTPYFPHCLLYHFIPLPFSYFISLSLCLYPLFLPFPLGCLYLLPLSWEWPSPKKQPHSGGPLYIVARTGH